MDLVDAAVRLLDGAHAVPNVAFLDVVLWNAERLVQCALLVLGSGDGTVVPVSIACVPPPAPEVLEPLTDQRLSDVVTLRTLRKIPRGRFNNIKDAIVHHQTVLRKLYATATARDDLEATKREFRKDIAVDKASQGAFAKAVQAYPEMHLEGTGLDEAMGSMSLSTGAPGTYTPDADKLPDPIDDVAGDAARALLEAGTPLGRWVIDDALVLTYDEAVAKEAVKKWAKEKREARVDAAVALVESEVPEGKEEPDELQKLKALKSKDTWDEAAFAREIEEALLYLRVARAEYDRAVRYQDTSEANKARAKGEREAEAAQLREQNVNAFYAAVTLAGAMLKGLLGAAAAPHLHVRSDAEAPKWVRANNDGVVKGCVSAFEAALLLDQLVSP